MLDTQGLPAYPPQQNAWQYPPPPIQKRWKWLAISATAFGAVAAVALTTTLVVMGNRDAPGLIDDTALTSVIDRECDLMTSTVESMPLGGSPRQQAQTIRDQNDAIAIMLTRISRGHGALIRGDRPAQQWLDDWGKLIVARERFATDLLRDGKARFPVPLDNNGVLLSERMADVWLGDAVCTVPSIVLWPYPIEPTAAI